MYTVEIYARVRRAVYVEGMSERQVAREFGLARESVRKMLKYSAPPGYRRQQPARKPKLDPWVGVIDAILEEDRERPGNSATQRNESTSDCETSTDLAVDTPS